jgi:glycosyltransferase involved in cell wall biosynthesis
VGEGEPVMKLLIVSYDFPPIGGVSVQRVLSLVKYLPENGFDVSVVTARNAASPVFDPALLEQIPSSVRVHRVWTPELSYRVKTKLWSLISRGSRAGAAGAGSGRKGLKSRAADILKTIFSPDPHVVWVPFALRRARKIVRRDGVDAVLVTAPPFSAFLIGNALKREFPGLRLVSDFRDEWLRYLLKDFDFFQGSAAQRKAAVIEKETVALSDLVVAVTQSSIAQLRQRYPEQPQEKFAMVPNGYDPAAFARFRPRPRAGDRILVAYVGTVYSVCSPRYYLDALDQLPEEVRDRFETVFVGRVVEDERKYLEGRKSRVRVRGFLPQGEALAQIEEADYVLLTVANDFCIAGKLFEYLAARKPVIAITPPDGETGRLVAETGGGWCVDPRDSGGIRKLLDRLHGEWQAGISSFAPLPHRIREYERPRLAGRFAALLKQACGAHPPARANQEAQRV